MPEIFEVAMLTCFSLGWYWSIVSMLCTRRPTGKSAPFVTFTIAGYVCGLAAKLWLWADGGDFSAVLYVYAWNLTVTLLDLSLVLHYSRFIENGIRRDGSAG